MASTNNNSNLASLSVGVYNPSDPEEILERIEEFLEGVVNEDLQDLPRDEGVWKLEASLNYAFRNTSTPIGSGQVDSLFFDIEFENGYLNGEHLRMVFN